MDANFKKCKAGLIGCLLLFTSGKADATSYFGWHINDLLKADTDTIHLTASHDKSLKKVERKQLIYLYSVAKAMEEVAETDANLFIVAGGEFINAFAGRRWSVSPEEVKILYRKYRGKKTAYIQGTTSTLRADKETTWVSNFIGINFKMLDMLGTDVHMAAALIGHELAHLRLDHGAEHRGKPSRHEQDVDSARYRRDNPIRKKGACRGYCITHPLSVERIMKSKSLARRLSRNN